MNTYPGDALYSVYPWIYMCNTIACTNPTVTDAGFWFRVHVKLECGLSLRLSNIYILSPIDLMQSSSWYCTYKHSRCYWDISKEAAKHCRPTKVHCTRSAKGIANKLKNLSCTKVKFSYKCYHGIAHWLEINQQSIGIVQQFLAWLWQEFCAIFIMRWWRMCMRYAAVAFGRLHQFIQNLGVCTVYIWRNWRPPIPPIVRYIQSVEHNFSTNVDRLC